MLIVHANWSQGALHLWAEEVARLRGPAASQSLNGDGAPTHPFAADTARVLEFLANVAPDTRAKPDALEMVLPSLGDAPTPSPEAAHAVGQAVALETDALPVAHRFSVPTVVVAPQHAIRVLEALEDAAAEAESLNGVRNGSSEPALHLDPSVRYFATVVRFVRYLLANQRWVPSLVQDPGGELVGVIQPWLADKPTLERLAKLGCPW
jgi:hypothetical protein